MSKGGLILKDNLRAALRVTVSIDSKLYSILALILTAAAGLNVNCFSALKIVCIVSREVKFKRCLVYISNVTKLVITNLAHYLTFLKLSDTIVKLYLREDRFAELL